MNHLKRSFLTLVVFLASGCSSTYFAAMEKVGYHKRDILSSRVEKAQDSQEEAKEQFRSALERFTAVISVDGGELQEKYDTLQAELDRSEGRADDLHKRVDKVEEVAEALFEEWEDELDDYSNPELRRGSEHQLRDTQRSYQSLIRSMRTVEKRIDPVLSVFRDQVLYLKHNLNAKALRSLRSELSKMELNVDRLVADMERSIDEAERFLKTMK